MHAFAQKSEIFRIDSLPTEGVLLNKGWKWHAGDNPEWAKADFDDSAWESIDPTKDIYYYPHLRKESIGWLRIQLKIDSVLTNKALAFQISQIIASEIFLNGNLIQKYGIVSNQRENVKAFSSFREPEGILFNQTNQVLAIRFSIEEGIPYYKHHSPFNFFQFRIKNVKNTNFFSDNRQIFIYLNFFYGGIFLILGIIHFGYFITLPKLRSNLYFSLFTFSACSANLLWIYLQNICNNVAVRVYMGIVNYVLLFSLFGLFLLLAIYSLFHKRKGFYYWFLVIYLLFGFILHFTNFKYGLILGFIAPMFLAIFESLLISWEAYKKGKRNVLLLVFGIGAYLLLYFTFILNMYGVIPRIDVLPLFDLSNICYHLSNIVITLSLSFHLSREFGFTTKDLERKLQEVQQLSEEKQQILATQNETLEKQVIERTAELNQSLIELKATQNQLIQKEKLASLGELTAGIAHEIQNPLNFVNNFSELSVDLAKDLNKEIQNPDSDKEYIEELLSDLTSNQEKINHHGKRASSIVKGMLEHSRASTGVKELTDINKLADEYLRLSYHGLRAKDKDFNANYELIVEENLQIGRAHV